jgi:hypothetical protein
MQYFARSRSRAGQVVVLASVLVVPVVTPERSSADQVCPVDAEIACGASIAATTVGAGSELSGYACAGAGTASGEEFVLRLRPQSTGEVQLLVSGLATDHDLYVLEGSRSPLDCIALDTTSGLEPFEVAFQGVEAMPYYLVVEAIGDSGSFLLESSTAVDSGCPESCDNGLDDDGDTKVDCEDPDCAFDIECGVLFRDDFESSSIESWSCFPD